MNASILAACCCDQSPPQCNCAGCPTAYAVQADLVVQYFGVTAWAPTMPCPNPFFSWVAQDQLVPAGGGCTYQASTPEGTFGYQAASTSCGFGQSANYNGSQTFSPYFVRVECALKSTLFSGIQQYITTPTAWRVIVSGMAGDLVTGVDLVQYKATAYYDRPQTCWSQTNPKCIEVNVSSGLAPLGPFVVQSAIIAGSIGSAQFINAPSVTAVIDQWELVIT